MRSPVGRVPIIGLLVLGALVLAGAGCDLGQNGIDPPLDQIFWPAGLAIDRDGNWLYVVNSNNVKPQSLARSGNKNRPPFNTHPTGRFGFSHGACNDVTSGCGTASWPVVESGTSGASKKSRLRRQIPGRTHSFPSIGAEKYPLKRIPNCSFFSPKFGLRLVVATVLTG